MGNKYEVLYWDYYVGKEVTVTYTGSFLKAKSKNIKSDS